MFLRAPLSRYKLHILANRIINTLNAEVIFKPTQISLWRSMANDDPVRALGDIADNIKQLRIETLKDYDIKTVKERINNDK